MPSPESETRVQVFLPEVEISSQVPPELIEVYIVSLVIPMTIFVRSLLVSIEFQPLLPDGIFSIHVVPLSEELNMFHADSAATNFVPSIDEKTTCQFFSAGKLVF